MTILASGSATAATGGEVKGEQEIPHIAVEVSFPANIFNSSPKFPLYFSSTFPNNCRRPKLTVNVLSFFDYYLLWNMYVVTFMLKI